MRKSKAKNSIKIFITYKDRNPILKSDILVPIQSGRALAYEAFDDMIGDDTGENISSRNDKYSELSAMYWVWKNYNKVGNPEYVGFMHYRRQFIFNEKLGLPYPKWISSFYYLPSLHEAMPFFSDDTIEEIVPQFDYIVPAYSVTPFLNIRDEYIYAIPGSRSDIFDTFIQVCREIHPDWEEEISKIEKGNVVQVCNMFVMKKELFFDYCNFAFPVLFELEKRIDTAGLSTNGLRFLGYMAEKLQTMFVFRLEKEKKYKEKLLNCTFIRRDIRKKDTMKISEPTDVFSLRAEFAKVHFPNINNRFGAGEYNAKLSFLMNHLLHFRLKKFGYALKKAFAFGERYAKYNDKYQKTKQLIKDAKKLKKSYYKV